MENNDVNKLIDAFVGYRDMLVPIQGDLHDFINTYNALRDDVEKLRKSFSDDAKTKLNEIYKSLSEQSQKSEELISKVDQFLKSSTKYTEEVGKLMSTFENINSRLLAVNEIEEKAENQIQQLDQIIQEKRRSYDLKELQKSLDSYSANLQSTSDFINKDVAENVVSNSKMIESIKQGNENIFKYIEDEKKSIEELVNTFNSSSEVLKKVVEKNDVNEQYIFDILDKWAEKRKVKIKKKD